MGQLELTGFVFGEEREETQAKSNRRFIVVLTFSFIWSNPPSHSLKKWIMALLTVNFDRTNQVLIRHIRRNNAGSEQGHI